MNIEKKNSYLMIGTFDPFHQGDWVQNQSSRVYQISRDCLDFPHHLFHDIHDRR